VEVLGLQRDVKQQVQKQKRYWVGITPTYCMMILEVLLRGVVFSYLRNVLGVLNHSKKW
jgi:hypothetical protein